MLHSPDYRGSGTIRVNEDVCLTATLEILRSIVAGKGPRDYMLALGYSGWSSGQLEDEIAANGWLVTHHAADIVFGGGDDSKYSRVMGAMGIDPVLLSADSGHA